MASAAGFVNVTGGDGNNLAAAPSPATTGRQVSSSRRRRLEPPRVATTTGDAAGPSGERQVRRRRSAAAGASSSRASSSSSLPQLVAAAAPAWPVAFGALSLAGSMFPKMEDTVSVRPGFHTWVDGSTMHFLGVFDGHGGFHVSVLCRDRMHEFLAEELQREGASFLVRREQAMAPPPAVGTSRAAAGRSIWVEQAEEELAWRAALARAFRRVDAVAALACACGRVARPPCRCPLAAASGSGGLVGSTAMAALLVRGHIVVANCGDSRAVLCRGPDGAPPIPLSDDHKPNRPDELARIHALGGRVVCNDVPRVRGILAMSRALGDSALRPEVIAEPEITVTERTADDQFMILASDGMWDVMSNKIACDVARQALELEERNTPEPPAAAAAHHEAELRCSNVATVLARFALARDTRDNISVVVVDLRQRD